MGELDHSNHISDISKEVSKNFPASFIEDPRFDQVGILTSRIGTWGVDESKLKEIKRKSIPPCGIHFPFVGKKREYCKGEEVTGFCQTKILKGEIVKFFILAFLFSKSIRIYLYRL